MVEKLIIIGSGPAGLTAALYAARAELKPVLFAGIQWGGQLMLTTLVENYPGFPDGIMGPDLMIAMKKQAEKFGTRIFDENVVEVDVSKKPFVVKSEKQTLETETIIVATGASTKWLGIENEQRLIGKGVSSCATCDGFFFKDKVIVVVGGGDTAMEDSIFLTKFVKKATIIHRRDKLRASKIMQDRAFANKKIEFMWDTVVTEVIGKDKVEGVKLKNTKTGEETEFKADGLFVAIGHKPETDIFKGKIKLDKMGYAIFGDSSKSAFPTMSNIEGVFISGDVDDPVYKQAVTAAGEGCKAAIDVEKYLAEKETVEK